jgi:hypothetical protein
VLVLLLPLGGLLTGCADGTPEVDPSAAASAPVPGVTLPPGAMVDLVPAPDEVPAGMVPIIKGSGSRSIDAVASYSGTGAAQAQAETSLRAHGFQEAYVAQYANQATGQVLSVLVTSFATAAGAAADFEDDQQGTTGTPVDAPRLGEASSVTKQTIAGSVASELLLVRFLQGAHTWTIAYQAAPTADPEVGLSIARTLLGRAGA